MAGLNVYKLINSPIGGNWLYFTQNQRVIGDFIESKGLEPVKIGAVTGRSRAPERLFRDLKIPGGIQVPHLHFNNKIYPLDDKQWTEFSKGIIAHSKATLAGVKQVGFEEGVLLGSVAQGLSKG